MFRHNWVHGTKNGPSRGILPTLNDFKTERCLVKHSGKKRQTSIATSSYNISIHFTNLLIPLRLSYNIPTSPQNHLTCFQGFAVPSPPTRTMSTKKSSRIFATSALDRDGSSSPISPADYVARIAPNSSNVRESSQGPHLPSDQHVSYMSHMTPPRGSPNYALNMNVNSGGSRHAAASADDNRPDRFELFLLGDGEKKVTEEADTRKSRHLRP